MVDSSGVDVPAVLGVDDVRDLDVGVRMMWLWVGGAVAVWVVLMIFLWALLKTASDDDDRTGR